MNKEQLKKSIDEYLKSDDELAYQINGQWGSGKTYFIKNEVIGEKNAIEDYKPVYLSINGIKNLDDLKKKLNINLLLSISSKENNKKFKAFSMLTFNIVDSGIIPLIPYLGSRYSNLKRSFKNSFNFLKENFNSTDKYKNIVIFIDEFERCSIPIKELVGYLSDILNAYGCKMIIISNEKEINEKDNFSIIKEKLINKSSLLSVSAEEIYKEIILSNLKNKVSIEVLKYIEDFNKEVCNILKYINIRTFKSVLSSFIQVLNKLKSIKENDLLDDGLKFSYTSIFVITYAMKQGLDLSNINDTGIMNTIFHQDNKNITPEMNYLKKFKYHKSFYAIYMEFPDLIKELVEHNYIDIDSYRNFVFNHFHKNDFNNIMLKLVNYRYLNDKELLKYENNSKDYYLNKELSIKQKIALYNNFSLFKEKNLLFINFNFDKLKNEICYSIINTKNDIDYAYNIVNGHYLKDNISQSITKRKHNKKNNYIYKILNYDEYNDNSFMYHIDEFINDSIFSLLLNYNNIRSNLLNNISLVRLDKFLQQETEIKNINIKDAGTFCNLLDEISFENDDKVFKYNIKSLKETINSIVKKSNK